MRYLISLVAVAAATPAWGQTAPAPVESIPESGTLTLRMQFGSRCVVAQSSTRPLVVPYLRGGECADALPVTAELLGQSRARLRLGGTTSCATVARNVVFGPRRVDIHPCDPAALDQQFRFEQRRGGLFVIRSTSGDCWQYRSGGDVSGDALANSDLVLRTCSDGPAQFRLFDLDRKLAVARPVAPPVPVISGAKAMPTRPPTPAVTGPMRPARYFVKAGLTGKCLGGSWAEATGGPAQTRVWIAQCNRSEWDLDLRRAEGESFTLTLGYVASCAALAASGPPTIQSVRCNGTAAQRFRIEPVTPGDDRYRIKVLDGRCWTVRGDPASADRGAAANHTAVFAEPCRDTIDQVFAFEWARPNEESEIQPASE